MPKVVELRTNLITEITNSSISFGWTESGDDDFWRYQIFRSTQPGVNENSDLIGEYDYAFWTWLSDSGLNSDEPYYYKIYTEDKGGKKSSRTEIMIRTSPDSQKYIYVTNWNGIIYKHDTDGTLLSQWQGFELNTGHASLVALYADNYGRVFVCDYGLNTVNYFNSDGKFISRWYGNNQAFKNRFIFQSSAGIAGHTTICGDEQSNIFIIDQTPYFYRTHLEQ